MKCLLYIFIALLFPLIGYSQCECTDCTVTLPTSGTASSEIDISGAANNTLGSGQQVCQVCINLLHDAIKEVDLTLISPSGDQVDLMLSTGIGIGQNISFEICFLSCDQSANPDSGFPSVFDSNAGYMSNNSYDGSYYPSNGCLEDLTGNVDGTWELAFDDNVGGDGGFLFDWYLVFQDDTGLGCANSGSCGSPPSCVADGGELDEPPVEDCEGGTDLDIDLMPSYPGSPPPSSEYDYTYIIVDLDNDEILDITMDTDMTGYAPGTYQICGLSYLTDDAGLLPGIGGTIDDIQSDIDDDEYCADLSIGCVEVTIGAAVTAPNFVGPLIVCAGELVEYEILDYDPNITYLISITGNFGLFQGSGAIYEVIFNSGPAGGLCAIIESPCGDVETCLDIVVEGSPGDLSIDGELEPCPGSTETYTFEPTLMSGETFIVTVQEGTIISQSGQTAEILWDDEEVTGEICIEIDPSCNSNIVCEDIEIGDPYELPSELDGDDDLCLTEINEMSIDEDNDIISYNWTVTNATIVNGQNTDVLEYEGDSAGPGTVCLEVVTQCGIQGPLCKDVIFYDLPMPQIDPIDPSCSLTFDLTATTLSNSNLLWQQESGPSTAIISPDDEDEVSIEVFNSGTYIFSLTEVNGPCEGTDMITVEILSDLETEEPIYTCNIDNQYQIEIEITSGIAPYSINGNVISGNVFISELIESDEDYSFIIEDNEGCTILISDQYTCPCLSDAGTMSLIELSACITGTDEVIATWNDDGLLDNNDTGMYILHDDNDDELGNIFYSNLSGIFDDFSALEAGETYYISYVVGNELFGEIDLDDPCLSVAEGQSFTLYDIPEFESDFQNFSCGLEIEINGDLINGEIIWSYLSGPGSIDFSEDDVPTIASASSPGTYIVSAVISNEGCTTTEDIELLYLEGPQITNPIEICNSTNDAYQVSIEVIGEEPFSSNVPGTFSGNIFTSNLITSGVQYQISFTDTNGCASEAITGSKLCDCTTDSGTMDNQLLTTCGLGNQIIISPASNIVLDPDDIGYFFLHDSPGSTLGTIISTSPDGSFGFTNGMIPGTTYYVSYVVGNDLNGLPDPNDPCLDVASGQPVVWLEFPIIMLADTISTCDNIVEFNAIPDNGDWRILESVQGATTDLTINPNGDYEFSFDQDGTYLLEYSASNASCITLDTIVIIKNLLPVIENVQRECADDLATYTLSFSITGSNGPFMVDGIMTDSEYSSLALDTNGVQNFIIENEFGCITEFTYGPVECNCESEVGTINTTPLELCTTESISISAITNGDAIISVGDTIAYVLHDGTATNIGNILSMSFGEDIPYDANLMTETPYFLSVVVSGYENGMIDFNDACLSFSEGVLIIWKEDTTVNFSEQFNICANEDVVLFPSVTGRFPINLILENELGEELSFDITSASDSIIINGGETDALWQIKEVNGECVSQADGQILISVDQPQNILLLDDVEICNNPIFGSTLSLSVLFEDGPYLGDWSSNDFTIDNGTIDVSGSAGGTYELFFSSIGFEGECAGSEVSTTITVEECDCPIFPDQDFEFCSSEGPIELEIFDNLGLEGNYSLSLTSGPGLPYLQNDSLYIIDAANGSYTLSYTITQANYPNVCEQVITYDFVVEQSQDAGIQNDILIECSDADITVNLNDLLDGESPGGEWSINSQLLPQVINIMDLSIGSNAFTYSIESQGICPSVSSIVEIIIVETPEIEVIAEDVLCFGDENGIITVEHLNGSGQSYMYYLNDLLAGTTNINNDLAPGDYAVYVENQTNCRSEVSQVTIGEPQPIEVTLGEDLLLDSLAEYQIEAIVNILESDISSISWSDLAGQLGITTLDLTDIATENNLLSIEILDENGCIGFDEIRIELIPEEAIEPSIYVPNVISLSSTTNDKFSIFNVVDVEIINQFRIYDRWGNLVYNIENTDPKVDNPQWDGSYNDELVEQGVYVYMIDLTLTNGDTNKYSGDITVIR